jgi:trigger factor
VAGLARNALVVRRLLHCVVGERVFLLASDAVRIIRPSTEGFGDLAGMMDKAHYEITRRDETEATVQVTIVSDEVQRGLDSVYRRYAREVRIPGFRRGHVPRHLLESRFGREVFIAEAKEDLQRQYVPEALSELDLQPVSTPRLEEVSHGESEPFVFSVTFAILPDVELPDLKELEVTVPPLRPVSEEDVQQALTDVQSHFSTLAEKEGDTVGDGDIVRVKENDREWDTRAESDNPVTKHLIDEKVGTDVEIDAELPDGKPFRTTLSVVGLQQIVLPNIDDELAKDAGFDDLASLRTDIETKLTEQRAERHELLTNTALLDGLVGKTEIPLPQAFLDELVDEELERVKASFDSTDSTSTFEEYLQRRELSEEAFAEEIRDSVSHRVRRELVLRQLGREMEIAIDDEELTDIAQGEAEERGEEPLRFVARLKANDRWDDYRASKVNDRVFQALRDAATVKQEEES